MNIKNQRLSSSARLYVAAVCTAGLVAVAHSLYTVLSSPIPISYHWFVLAGLTLLTGSFTVRIPTIPARLSVSETFVFAAVLLFGAAAATIIVVLDTLIISLCSSPRSRKIPRVLFNTAAPSVAIWVASNVFYWMAGIDPLSDSPRAILSLVAPLLVLATLYFLLNSFLIAGAVAFDKGLSALAVWRQNFLWLSLNYFSGASVAALLLPYLQSDFDDFAKVIGVLLPLLLISYLTFKTALGRVDDANRHLSELNRLYLSTIETLAMAIDAKDQITHGHIRRVQMYAVRLARSVGVTDVGQIRAIEAAALLHDMGKLAVPEYILNKPGALTPAEFEKMKLHASVGADILSAIDFPYPVVPIVRHHHENWDGTGYPDRISGANIPIGARVLSVVDCFDALTSDRPYRPRLSDAEALKILVDRRGTMYDPLIVDTFVQVCAEITPETRQTATVPKPFTAITDAASPPPRSLGNDRSLAEIAASSEEMLSLFNLSRGLSGQMGLSDIADVILKHLKRMTPFTLAVLYVYDDANDELVAAYTAGEHSSLVHGLRISLGQRLTGWVGAHRQVIRNSDPILDFGEMTRALMPRPRSCLSTPMVVREKLVGVLSLYSSEREAFSESHQRVVEAITPQIASAVQNGITFDRAKQIAYRDQITGLPNAQQLHQFARDQHADGDTPVHMSIIHIDIQGLETLNLAHGRDVGDNVLKHVAQGTKAHLRPSDLLFRYGSDEFVAVLLQTSANDATAIASGIRESVEAHWTGLTGVKPAITVAIASSPSDGLTVESLITAARLRLKSPAEPRNGGRRASPPESVH